jgi:GNAT superfamily N-acetyltransferase
MGATPDEACRPATEADLPRLAELVAAAIEELRAGKGGEVWARSAARQAPFEPELARQVADPVTCVLVGTVDGVVLGYGVATTETLRDGGRLGVVTDLYTEPGARELGLGEAMMEALVAWCREQGCFGVDSLALPGDRHTKNFFESFGLVARAIVVHRSLL